MYFDPGTGSMLIQALIGIFAALGAFFVAFRTNFINFFKGKIKKKNEKK